MSDDKKDPKNGSPKDPMAHAREAKAKKAAQKKAGQGDKPEMEVVRETVTKTEKYVTPSGRDVEKTTETVREPKKKAERRKVIYSKSDLDAMEEAERRKNADLFKRLTRFALRAGVR